MTTLEVARSGAELMGAVSVHGTLKTAQRCGPGAVKAKILVCHGALDPHVPMAQVNDFIAEMTDAGTDWQLIVYGGALTGLLTKAIRRFPESLMTSWRMRGRGLLFGIFCERCLGWLMAQRRHYYLLGVQIRRKQDVSLI